MSMIVRCASLVLILQIGFSNAEIKDKGWWKRSIIYEIVPQSYKDSNNDGYGDFKGIQQKLEYIKDLGIDTILLRPIYPKSGDQQDDVTYYTDIHPKFGGMNDFENLIKDAKNRSMKVILDFIPNHMSTDSIWFQASMKETPPKFADYFIWHNGTGEGGSKGEKGKEPNNWKAVGTKESAWIYNETREQWYLSQFGGNQADLNYKSKEVLEDIDDALRFWLNKGVDGFRMDKISYIYENDDFKNENEKKEKPEHYDDYEHTRTMDDPRNHDLVARWRNLLDDWADQKNETEKILLIDANITQAVTFYNNGSNIPINYNLTLLDSNSNPEDFKKAIENWNKVVPHGHVANWITGDYNHHRIASRFHDRDIVDKPRSDQITMLNMILPGIAFTYYGEEIGMIDKMDNCRSVFQWTAEENAGFCSGSCSLNTSFAPSDDFKNINVAVEMKHNNSFLSHYQELVKLRHSSEILENGTLSVHSSANKTLVVVRQLKDKSIVLVMNFENKNQTINVGTWIKDVSEVTVLMASKTYEGNLVPKTKLDPSKIELQIRGALLLLTKSSGALTMASSVLLIGCSLLSVFRVFNF